MTTKETSLQTFHPKMVSKINNTYSQKLLFTSLKRVYQRIRTARATSFEPPPVKAKNASYTLSTPIMRMI